MATGKEEAKFSVVLDDKVSDSAEDAAEAVEALRQRLAGGEQSVKEMSAALRRLKGSTDEVKKAKEELKAKIAAEKDAISSAQLAMLKLSDTAKKLAKQKEDAKEKTKALGSAIGTAGGPVAALRDKLATLKEITSGSNGATAALTLAAAGLVALLAALTVAAGAAAFSLAKFVVGGANAARSANLLREAAAGSAANAYALGTQVDALARKIPTGKAAINELAVSLAKGGVQGQTLVDTLNAVAQANAALGDDAGAKLREFVDRGRLTQRMVVNPLELQGTGLQFDDIAKELASSMKVGINEARAALFEGRVKLADGAKALRDAVEKKFGGINLRKMLDLEVIASKLRERFDSLTNKVNIEPLLRGFEKIASVFDETTVSGAALKELVTVFGSGLAKSIEASAPLVKKFLQGMIISTLQLSIFVLQLRKRFRETFGDVDVLKNIDGMKIALEGGKLIVASMAVGLGLVAVAIGSIVVGIGLFATGVKWLIDNFPKALQVALNFFSGNWAGLGASVVDGLIEGLTGGAGKLGEAVEGLANKVKNTFRDALVIRSPSKVGKTDGSMYPAGVAEGIEDGIPDVVRAADEMAVGARTQPAGAGAARGAVSISIPITINVSGGDAAKQLSDPNFLTQLTRAIEDALVSAGIPAPA